MHRDTLDWFDEMLLSRLEGLDDVSELRQAIADVHRTELTIVVAGDFNNGKSMLLNALLGRRLLVSSPVPTTGCVTRIRYGEEEHIVVRDVKGVETRYTLDDLERVTVLRQGSDELADVDHVTIYCNAHILTRPLVLVDTPGTDDDPHDRARGALRSADVILWLIRADRALRKGERELAASWLDENRGALLLPVVNFMNFVCDQQAPAVVRRLQLWLQRKFGPRVADVKFLLGRNYFEINAHQALSWSAEGAGEPDVDFTALLDLLGRLKGDVAARLIARTRSARICNRIESVRKVNAASLHAFSQAAADQRLARHHYEREREFQLRSFAARADAFLAAAEKELQQKLAYELSEGSKNYLYYWLNNESLSSLRQNANEWGRTRLGYAATPAVVVVNTAWKALAEEFAVDRGTPLKIVDLSIAFNMEFPFSEVIDDLKDVFDLTATDAYIKRFRSNARLEWQKQTSRMTKSIREAWMRRVSVMQQALEARLSASVPPAEGWSWTLAQELIEIKAWEIWVGRIGHEPRTECPSSKANDVDWAKAEATLAGRIEAGEPIRTELVDREAAAAALDALEARHVRRQSLQGLLLSPAAENGYV